MIYIRLFIIWVKGKKPLLKIIKKRQMFERLLLAAKTKQPFLYGYMTPKDFEKAVNAASIAFFTSKIS